jgi:flavodoxin
MNAVIYCASRSGNTRAVADAIAEGLRAYWPTRLQLLDGNRSPVDSDADLVLVGGPTEGHGMTDAVSEFLDRLSDGWLRGRAAAAFDTRLSWPRWLSGSAAADITKRLQASGACIVAGPESFIVTAKPELHAGELERARAWGAALGKRVHTTPPLDLGVAS